MNARSAPRAVALPWAAAALASLLFAGCLTDDMKNDVDPFPKPVGPYYIPLDRESHAAFRYAEFDSAGNPIKRVNLPLHVYRKAAGIYAYAFEDAPSGLLLSQRDGNGNLDSAGIYIVGRYRDTALSLDSAPVLWLPQKAKPGTAWPLSPTRSTELVSADTSFWTEALDYRYRDTASPVSAGLQRQRTALFKETAGDTLTFYHFRPGIGCVGFQRSARGRLIAVGSLYEYYSSY